MTETAHRTQAQRREQTRTALLDATIEQKKGGEMVVKATDSIATVARQNLSAVESITVAARNLAQEADTLRARVIRFFLVDRHLRTVNVDVMNFRPARPARCLRFELGLGRLNVFG